MEEKNNDIAKTPRKFDTGIVALLISILALMLQFCNSGFEKYAYFDGKKNNSAGVQSSEKYSQEVVEYARNMESAIDGIYSKTNRCINDTTCELDIEEEIGKLRVIWGKEHYQSIKKFPDDNRQYDFAEGMLSLILDYKTLPLDKLHDLIASLKEIVESPTFQKRAANFKLGKNQLVLNDEKTKSDSTLAKQEASFIISDTILYYSSLDSFIPFVEYLIVTKNIDDSDVLFAYGVVEDDLESVSMALRLGANKDVTDVELVAKYSDEYEEYYIQHYNDKKNHKIDPNEFDDEKEKKTFDWNGFIRFINVLQLVVVLLLVVVVVLYINSIKKKFDSHNDSNNKIMEELQKRSEEAEAQNNIIKEEVLGLKTDLEKYIDWEKESEKLIDEIWAEMKKTNAEEDEKYGDEGAKGDETWKNAEFFKIKVMDTQLIMGVSSLAHRIHRVRRVHKDDNSDIEVKYKNIYIVPFGGSCGGTSKLLGNLLSTKKEDLDNINIWLKNELIKEEHDVLVNESFKALKELLELYKKKKDLNNINLCLTKEKENEIREKLFNNADNSDRLFCEWLRKYLEQSRDSKEVRISRIDKETRQLLNEYHSPSMAHNLYEATIKHKCLNSIIDLLELEIDYNFEYILTDYFSNVYHEFQQRLDYYYETYNYLKDLWIMHEKIKIMINGLTQKNSNEGETFNRSEESKTRGSQKSMSNDKVNSEKDVSSSTEEFKGEINNDDCFEEQ